MPRGDRSGPNGMGSGTGRRAGYCYGNDVPGFMSGGFGGRGRGFGFGHGYAGPGYGVPGYGRGFGFRRGGGRWYDGAPWAGPGYYDGYPDNAVSEKEMLERNVSDMKSSLKAMEERLGELNQPANPDEK